MSELSLKNYYDKQFEGVTIDIADSTMNAIQTIKGRGEKSKVKMIAVVAAVMIFIMGCGYLGVSTFIGPDGQLLWQLRTDSVSEAHAKAYSEAFNSLNLEEGDMAYILLEEKNNPEGIVDISQKPWSIDDLDVVQSQLKSSMGIKIDDKYQDFQFERAEGFSVFSDNEDEAIMEELHGRIGEEAYVYDIIPTSPEEVTSYYLYFTRGRDELTISLMPWLGNVVNYTSSENRDGQVLEVNGYQGLVIRDKTGVTYEILIDERYVSVYCSDSSFTNDALSEIIESILGL